MMNEWIISSSLLIAAVLLGRRLLRGKISLRLQYALWAVVLVRLLLPVQLFTSDFGAGTIARDVDISAPVRDVYMSANEDRYEREYEDAYRWASDAYTAIGQPADPIVIEQTAQELAQTTMEVDLKSLLTQTWLGGMAAMTAVIVFCNLHLSRRLKRSRREYPATDCLLPVYVTEVLPTPCIFGLFHPAIYLTADTAKEDRVRAHVLLHEQTHYRHGDHIWSVLRSICLVLHWYNPLVWLAVKASKADAELACDEGVLARLGEGQRGDYGRTLIGLTCAAPMGDFLLTATTMTGSIRERIKLLMQRPRNTLLALTAVVLIGVLVVGCSFAGAPESTPPATEPDDPAETQTVPVETQPDAGDPEMIAFFHDLLNPYDSWYSRALTSYYDSPAGIDLYQLFYNGIIPGADNIPTRSELAFLESQPGYYPDFDLFRIPGAELARVLNEYLDIDLAATSRIGLENFMYDPQSDCYYHCHTDTNANAPTVTAAHELPNGNWRVFYTNGFLGDGVVTLRQREGKWQIVSHLPIEVIEPGQLTDANGILVYPGTKWGMTMEEVLTALNITEYGIMSGNYGFILFDQTFLGQNAEIAFYFTQYNTKCERGLSSVRVTLQDSDTAYDVCTQLIRELGKPDFQTSGVDSSAWFSDRKLEELISPQTYQLWQQYREGFSTQPLIVEMGGGTASMVYWYGARYPQHEQATLTFSSELATARQIEALCGPGQTILADFADADFRPYYTYLSDEGNTTSIAFTPTQRLRNVEFGLLIPTDATPNGVMQILYSMDELDPQHPFLAQVVFWGDTTTYFISFTDESRSQRRFVVSISSEDGSLVCTESPIDQNFPVEYVVSLPPDLTYARPMEQAMEFYADRNPRKLNEKELQAFRSAFTTLLDETTVNPAACFLLPYYADISEMDGSEFLAYFPRSGEATREEFDLLKAKYPEFLEHWTWENMPIPIHRYEADAIEAVVSRYGNIHWAELDEGVHYLEETGCYYNYTSDFGLGGFYARGGFVYDGGAVVYSDFSALFFTETRGQYTIQAHLPALVLTTHYSNPMIPADG